MIPPDLSSGFGVPGAEPETGTNQHTGLFDGTALTVRYRLDHVEHARRAWIGAGAASDEPTLAALLAIPEVGLGKVPRRFGATLKRAEAAQLAVLLEDPEGGQWGQRKLRAPLEVIDIEVNARDWRMGSAVAHRWAGYASRLVRLERDACNKLVLSEASYWGIGIATTDNDEPLLHPMQKRLQRWSSARWRFAEQVYGQLLLLADGLP